MPDYKELRMIAIYLYISKLYEIELQYTCKRYSNNASPEFTDEELMTIYLFVITQQHLYQVKEIYTFAKEYMYPWFPKLPSYQAFNNRLNRLSEAFKVLVTGLIQSFIPENCDFDISLTDSMPVVTCKQKNRKAGVAREIVDKGYCSTKNMYYYGLKLHLLAFRRPGTIPFPEFIGITAASENDLSVFKELFGYQIINRVIFGDKIFMDKPWFDDKKKKQNIEMLTPIKRGKDESKCITQREQAYRNLYSAAVSRVRQPVESFFNWLNEKTKIQEASKVRSTKGLAIHVYGKLAAAFIYLIY